MGRYWVSAVRYNAAETHIDSVREHYDDGTTLGDATATARGTVVSRITSGTRYDTMYASNSKWTAGAKIDIVTVNGTKYLRTDADKKAADNLGNLPRF